MLKRVFGTGIALGLVTVMALPFAREIYHRHEVGRQLSGMLDSPDRAAFAGWNGSALSFVETLRDRCVRVHGGNANECGRYRIVSR